MSPGDLGLCPDEDLDALAYDSSSGIVVLSTDPAARSPACPARDPISYVRLGTDAAILLPLIYLGGLAVSADMGLIRATPQIDDVDAICGLDPACGSRQSGIPLESALGMPWPVPLPPGFAHLETQAWREGGLGPHRWQLAAHGAQPGSIAVWMLSTTATWPGQLIPMQTPLQVPLTSPFAGAPIGPRFLQVPPSFGRYDILVQWLSFDISGPANLHVAAPLLLRSP